MSKVWHWWNQKQALNRWQILIAAFFLGVSVAGVVYIGQREAEHAAQQRRHDRNYAASQRAKLHHRDHQLAATQRRIASALKRLQRLENPSHDDVKRLINSFLRNVSPAQAAELQRVLNGQVTSAPPTGEHEPSGRPSNQRRTSPPPRAGTMPPGAPSPSRPPPTFDLPPIDPDGTGPLPSVDPPPVTLCVAHVCPLKGAL